MTPEIGREIVNIVRDIKPDILVNSRLLFHDNQVQKLTTAQLSELSDIGVDFLSYRDRTIPPNSPWEYWETCMTLNDSWGYRATDNQWKSSKNLGSVCFSHRGNNLNYDSITHRIKLHIIKHDKCYF